MKRFIFLALLLMVCLSLFAQEEPEWLTRRPRSDTHLYGRGLGPTAEEAEEAARRELQLQLSSQINAVVRLESASLGVAKMDEKLDVYFGTARLRSAEVEKVYENGEGHHALLSYPEDCGLVMAKSAAMYYAEELLIDPEEVIEALDEKALIKGARMERVIYDATQGNYGGDVSVLYGGGTIRVEAMNFEAYAANLTATQSRGLEELSRALFDELEGTDYHPARVTGFANPTGASDEEEALQFLSEARAETMATYLRKAGIEVGETRGAGASRLTGDPATEDGRGLNRRVEIEVEIKR